MPCGNDIIVGANLRCTTASSEFQTIWERKRESFVGERSFLVDFRQGFLCGKLKNTKIKIPVASLDASPW